MLKVKLILLLEIAWNSLNSLFKVLNLQSNVSIFQEIVNKARHGPALADMCYDRLNKFWARNLTQKLKVSFFGEQKLSKCHVFSDKEERM